MINYTLIHARRLLIGAGLSTRETSMTMTIYKGPENTPDMMTSIPIYADEVNGPSVRAEAVDNILKQHGSGSAHVVPDKGFSETLVESVLIQLQTECHNASYAAGWWHHPETGYPYIPGDTAITTDAEDGKTIYVPWEHLPPLARQMITHYWPILIACRMALIHSETSEAMEAHRKDLFDDKLKHRLGLEAETADAMIRQFDLAGAMQRASTLGVVSSDLHRMNLGGAVREKRAFNKTRPDHKIAARRAAGGKKY